MIGRYRFVAELEREAAVRYETWKLKRGFRSHVQAFMAMLDSVTKKDKTLPREGVSKESAE